MQSSHETLAIVEEKKQAEVGIEETLVVEETNRGKVQVATDAGETCKVEHLSKKDSSSLPSDSSSSSSSSESEDEEVGEYQPHRRAIEEVIREEQEEEEDLKRKEHEEKMQPVEATPEGSALSVPVEQTPGTAEDLVQENAVTIATEEKKLSEEIKQDLGEEKEEEQLKVNGDVSHVDIDVAPQIICCSEVNGTNSLTSRLSRDASGGENRPAFLLLLSLQLFRHPPRFRSFGRGNH